MSQELETPEPDLVRWTFTPIPAKRDAIVAALTHQGFLVQTCPEGWIFATTDEPPADPEELAERLWSLHGEPFEITQEEFRRTSLVFLEHEEVDDSQAAA